MCSVLDVGCHIVVSLSSWSSEGDPEDPEEGSMHVKSIDPAQDTAKCRVRALLAFWPDVCNTRNALDLVLPPMPTKQGSREYTAGRTHIKFQVARTRARQPRGMCAVVASVRPLCVRDQAVTCCSCLHASLLAGLCPWWLNRGSARRKHCGPSVTLRPQSHAELS